MQLFRSLGPDPGLVVFDAFAGTHSLAVAALMSGHHYISADISYDQCLCGHTRLTQEFLSRMDLRANTPLKLPFNQMLVHSDDVDKDRTAARYLPKKELILDFGEADSASNVPYRRACEHLKAS